MINQIKKLARPWQKKNCPGLIIAAEEKGRRLFTVKVGYSNLEFDVKINENTIFQIASVSKQFTAACIAILVLENKVLLKDRLSNWFDNFPGYSEIITIEMLVHHTSGLRDTLPMKILSGRTHEDHSSLADTIELIRAQKELNFEPGTRHLYSNAGYALLAGIVEKASGKTLGQYARDTFFTPLGMKSTLFDEDHHAIIKNRAVSYERIGQEYRTLLKNDDECGASGILTTVSDLLTWNANLSTGMVGGERFVSLMQQTGKLRDGSDTGYAFGLMIDEKYGQRRIHHAGSFLGFRAQSIRYPEEDLTIVCLSNNDDTSPVNLCDLAYQMIRCQTVDKILPVNKRYLPKEELRKYSGIYQSPKSNWVVEVVLNDQGALTVHAFTRIYESIVLSETEFFIPETNTKLVFFENDELKVCIKVFIDDSFFDEFEIQENVALSDDKIQELCGIYESEELQARYFISSRGGELYVNRRGQILEELKRGVRDTFILGTAFVDFNRDPKGKVTHLVVRGERITGIEFLKVVIDPPLNMASQD